MSARAAAVIVAGGRGARLGGEPKQFRPLGGRPMLTWSCAAFARHPALDTVIVVLPAERAAVPPAWLAPFGVRVVAGGDSRRASAHAGLTVLDGRQGRVLIHDAARPFVSPALITRLVDGAEKGPVIPVLPVADAIKRMRTRRGDADDMVESTLDRDRLRSVQTPQAFPLALIRDIHAAAEREAVDAPDDAALCEREGIQVRAIPGERYAFKVTAAYDLAVAEWLVESGRVAWPGDSE